MLPLLLLGLSAPASAADVIVFGDSWAAGSHDELRDALVGHGLHHVFTDSKGVGGATADHWANVEPDALHEAVSANPDARWVWLSITGNDVFWHHANGLSAQSASTNEANLRTIFDNLFAVHPDMKVVMFGYDFVNFEQSVECVITALQIFGEGVTSEKVNNIFLNEVGAVQERVAADYPNVTYVPHLWGTLQHADGVPNAPDVTKPSPAKYYGDCIHPTSQGYRLIHDALVASYWGDEASDAWTEPDDAPSEPEDPADEPSDDTDVEPAQPEGLDPSDEPTGVEACGCATPLPRAPWALLAGVAWLTRRRRRAHTSR